jgi:hypothetical protein
MRAVLLASATAANFGDLAPGDRECIAAGAALSGAGHHVLKLRLGVGADGKIPPPDPPPP